MKKKFNQLAGVMICIFFAVFLLFLKDNFGTIWSWISTLLSILTPFVYGFGLAYILNFPYRFFREKIFGKIKTKCFEKVNKPLSLIVTYVLFLSIVAFLIAILIPQLTDNINKLVESLPVYLESFIVNTKGILDWANSIIKIDSQIIFSNWDNISEYIINTVSDILNPKNLETISSVLFPAVFGTAMFIYNLLMSFIISIYMLSSKELLCRQVKRFCVSFLPTMWIPKLFKVIDVTDNKCGKFLVGKILDSTIIGALCFIAMSLLGIPYAPLISVIIGGTNVIPFFGPFIGAIPCGILLLFVSPFDAFKFAILVFVLQQLDGNFIGPKVVGSQVGLIGFWSLFSVIVAGGLFGVPGMILGTPIFAAIYTLMGDKVDKRIKNKGEAGERALALKAVNSSSLTNLSLSRKSKKKRFKLKSRKNKIDKE